MVKEKGGSRGSEFAFPEYADWFSLAEDLRNAVADSWSASEKTQLVSQSNYVTVSTLIDEHLCQPAKVDYYQDTRVSSVIHGLTIQTNESRVILGGSIAFLLGMARKTHHSTTHDMAIELLSKLLEPSTKEAFGLESVAQWAESQMHNL